MDTSLSELQAQIKENLAKVEQLDKDIASAMSSKVELLSENEKLQYAVDFLSRNLNKPINIENVDKNNKLTISSQVKSAGSESKPLTGEQTVLNLYCEGDSYSVEQVFRMAVDIGIGFNKPTINAVLHRLAKKGILQKLGGGIYRMPKKGESSDATELSYETQPFLRVN